DPKKAWYQTVKRMRQSHPKESLAGLCALRLILGSVNHIPLQSVFDIEVKYGEVFCLMLK
ncbi:MAG: hypothetical protein WKF70_14580, partial [Chitinophagaceae bacterium]